MCAVYITPHTSPCPVDDPPPALHLRLRLHPPLPSMAKPQSKRADALPPLPAPSPRRRKRPAPAVHPFIHALLSALMSSKAADDELYPEDLGVMWPSPADNSLARPHTGPDGQSVSVDVSTRPPRVCAARGMCSSSGPSLTLLLTCDRLSLLCIFPPSISTSRLPFSC